MIDPELGFVKTRNRGQAFARKLLWGVTAALLVATGYHLTQKLSAKNVLDETGSHRGLKGDKSHDDRLSNFQQCAISRFLDTGLPFLDGVSPIGVFDFEERRDRLAQALVAEDADAFVVEPGYTFKYYANVSQPEWVSQENLNWNDQKRKESY